MPSPALVKPVPAPKSEIAPLTARVPPLATVQVWLEASPTLALMVLVPLVFWESMPLPTVLPLALVASMVNVLVPPMVTPPAAALKVRLLMSKSTSSTLVARLAGEGVVVEKVTLVW